MSPDSLEGIRAVHARAQREKDAGQGERRNGWEEAYRQDVGALLADMDAPLSTRDPLAFLAILGGQLAAAVLAVEMGEAPGEWVHVYPGRFDLNPEPGELGFTVERSGGDRYRWRAWDWTDHGFAAFALEAIWQAEASR